MRNFQPEDWDAVLSLADLAVPFAPRENLVWFEFRKAFDEQRALRRHYIAEIDGAPAGYGAIEQQDDDPTRMRIFVVCRPDHLMSPVGEALFERLMADVGELGVSALWARELQADEPAICFFRGRGFIEIERFTLPNQPPMIVLEKPVTG